MSIVNMDNINLFCSQLIFLYKLNKGIILTYYLKYHE